MFVREFWRWGGALTFYTILPLPRHWPLDFSKVASWAPSIGLFLGCLLGGVDYGLAWVHCPWHIRNITVLILWIGITGGLHLDGVIDTADGLAVPEPERRLVVMQDSRTGAFGVMAAIVLVLLKFSALLDYQDTRCYGLMMAATWGRWGQYLAILRYPYLKSHGKGAFHRQSLEWPWDLSRPLLVLGTLLSIPWLLPVNHPLMLMGANGIALVLTWAIGAWFYRHFQGMTGDIYGAIVEWSEACILVSLCILL